MTARIVSQSAQDHFENRVAPAYSAFLRLKSRENAIAAAVAFWEMRDHLRGGMGKREFNQRAFGRCPEFRVIQNIAEASKYAELNMSGVIVSGISGTGSIGGEATLISPLGAKQMVPPCTLQIDLRDGTHRMMEDVLAIVARFLRAEISQRKTRAAQGSVNRCQENNGLLASP
jgi:hypothetical protein